jgi:hypothetical protein
VRRGMKAGERVWDDEEAISTIDESMRGHKEKRRRQ